MPFKSSRIFFLWYKNNETGRLHPQRFGISGVFQNEDDRFDPTRRELGYNPFKKENVNPLGAWPTNKKAPASINCEGLTIHQERRSIKRAQTIIDFPKIYSKDFGLFCSK
jgi:hypothetical protein